MELLPLEKLFPERFAELGIQWSDRRYFEDIEEKAKFDDRSSEITAEQVRQAARTGYFLQGLDRDEIYFSPEQVLYAGNAIPFFRRRSANHNGLIVIYDVYSTEDLQRYRDQADQIIREGKIAEQFVSIVNEDGLVPMFFRFEIKTSTAHPGCVEVDYREDELIESLGQRERNPFTYFRMLEQLNEKPFSPEEVCDAVIRFIR